MNGLHRIVMHWSAGAASNQVDDRDYYHEIVTRDGSRVLGKYRPEANISIRDADGYAPHTRNLNTGSIGLSMDAMRGAIERPFNAGPEPITEVQLRGFVAMVAEYARRYGIAVTPQTVLSHAEVQPTLKVRQRGKWDITWLPGMSAPGDPVAVGAKLRAMVLAVLP